MNTKQFLLVTFLFYGLMQQNILYRYRPTSLRHNDKEECKLLRREILAILHEQRFSLQHSQNSANTYRHVMASIAMFEALKCSRFENNF